LITVYWIKSILTMILQFSGLSIMKRFDQLYPG
jgi:hypothetical protein